MLSDQEKQFVKDAMHRSKTKEETKLIITLSRCSKYHNMTVFDVDGVRTQVEADLQTFYQEL